MSQSLILAGAKDVYVQELQGLEKKIKPVIRRGDGSDVPRKSWTRDHGEKETMNMSNCHNSSCFSGS